MDDELLLRYSRQILLPQIDIDGQEKLIDSHVVIVGLGGLGSPISMYLAAAGVGQLTLIDFDTVELSNLQRQIVHSTADLNRPKVESARDRLLGLNPEIDVHTINEQLDEPQLSTTFAAADVIVDATDNFDTRYMINRAAYREKKPLVSGAAIRFEGQVSVFRHDQPEQACYQCIYRAGTSVTETCSQTGVIAPLLGIIGSVQALETIKVLTGAGSDLSGRLLLLDSLAMDWHTMKFKKDPKCPVCSQ